MKHYPRKYLLTKEKLELIQIIDELEMRICAKNETIRKLQARLKNAKSKMQRMDETLRYMRKRILELHS